MKLFNEKCKNRSVIWGCLLIIVNLIFFGLFLHGYHYYNCINDHKRQSELLKDKFKDVSIINSDCYVQHPMEVIREHNKELLSILTQRETSQLSWIMAKEDSKNQVRIIYFMILAAIISFLFSRDNKIVFELYTIILIVIFFMFVLDVHQEDVFNIQRVQSHLTNNAIDSLINSYPDNIWWNINDKNYENKIENLRGRCERYCRKFQLACEPNAERIVYYQIPWIFISLLIIYNSCKKRANKPKKRNSS